MGLACTARIFLLSNFVASHDFSPNALKHIVCENQAGSWEQDENAKNARGVWFSYQFGTFWASSSRTGFCKNLLLALVFTISGQPGPVLEASVVERPLKRYACLVGKMY